MKRARRPRVDKNEPKAIWIITIVIVVVIILAIYGYSTGAWNAS